MKLLKLIPVAAIVLTAFTTFEAKAGYYPDGYTKKNKCEYAANDYYKLQKTDTPASYGVYKLDPDYNGEWIIENTSYNCATNHYKWKCNNSSDWDFSKPTCS